MMEMLRFISLFLLILVCNRFNQSIAQTVNAEFNLPTQACQQEDFLLENNSTDASSYFWDFANLSDLTFSQLNNTLINNEQFNLGIKTIENEGNWYVFIIARLEKKIYRMDFGNDLNSTPTIVDLITLNANAPDKIDVVQDSQNGNWYGFVTTNGNGFDLIRLDFGSDLTSVPAAVNLGNPGNSLNIPRGISVQWDESWIIGLSNINSDQVVLYNLGTSLETGLEQSEKIIIDVPEADRLIDIDFVKVENNWFGFTVSRNNGGIHMISFGEQLFSMPSSFTNFGDVANIANPANIDVINEFGNYYVYLFENANRLYRLSFGSDFNNPNPHLTNFGDFGVLTTVFAVDHIFDGSVRKILAINQSSKRLYQFSLPTLNPVNKIFSTEAEPSDIHFLGSGTFPITLTAFDDLDNSSVITKQLMITNNLAPAIEVGSDDISCVTSVIQFTGSNLTTDQSITTWNWDFGDGATLNNAGPNPTHQYTLLPTQNSDTFKIKLNALSDNGCSQNTQKEIIIFNEPSPDFNVLDAIPCTNNLIAFENVTPGNYGDVISWAWDFGDGESSMDRDPVHEFNVADTYNVKLIASIPGCTTETTISVDVSEGPLVDYSFTNDCFNNSITFTNNTTGTGITDYTWDFGDGVTSNLLNPTHTFADPGDYTIMLTVDNAIGCSVTNTQTLTIHALPEVAFINELACSNGSTQFFDESTAAGANITGWEWDFGDGNSSTEEDPIHVYQNSGSFLVSLTATTNFGCSAILEKTVDVIVGPTVDFTVNQVCLGGETQFAGLSESTDGAAITSWFWEIDGQTFTGQNPTATFALPGTYQVSLTVTSSTFCTATITKDIVINPLPVADFSVENACVDDIVLFNDESVATGDAITTYDWNFGNLGNSSDINPDFTFEDTGNYNVNLTITTAAGCVSNVSKTISILDRPEGAFTTDVSQGPPPLAVNFQNNSAGADSFDWDFGNGESSTVTNPIFNFTDLGVFEVTMVASTDDGCTDTVKQSINIVEPLMDLALEGMTTLSQDGKTRVSLDIRNNGTLFIDKVEVALAIGSEASVTETIEETIAPGALVVYPLNISITNRGTTPYLCATLTPLESAFVEENFANNTFCINLNEKPNVINPFPNPSDRLVTVGVVLQESQKVIITMHNAIGQPVLEQEIPDAPEGLSEFKVDVSGIVDGIYWLKLRYGTSEEVFRVFVEK